MPKRNAELLLADILDAIEKIERYLRGMSYQTFSKDDKTVDAVIRNFEIIGEAANQLPAEFTAQHPRIPWRDLADFRNVLIHQYFGVDLRMVWEIAEMNLGELKQQLQAIK
jgi:uncharacterized protein with HEPN domain